MFRRRKLGPSQARVTVHLHAPRSADEFARCLVVAEGSGQVITHALGAYFDKILYNLARMPVDQESLLDRFESFVYAVCDRISDELDGEIYPLAEEIPIVGSAEGKPSAQIRVELALLTEQRRIGATTHFKPLRAMNETVAEYGLWALNNWLVHLWSGREKLLHPLYDNLAEQCDYYRANGMPGMFDLGRAPFEAVVEGMRRRTAADTSEPERASEPQLEGTGAEPSTPAAVLPPAEEAAFDRHMQEVFGVPDIETWVEQAKDSAFVRVWPRWEELRQELPTEPVAGLLFDALKQRVKRLDWGRGDLVEQVLSGGRSPDIEEGVVGLLLTKIAMGGYIWREAERQIGTVVDQEPLAHLERGLSFAREQPSSREQQGEELMVTAAFWAMEGLGAPLTIYGGLQEPLLLVADATAETIRKERGWEVYVPPRSRDEAFLYGYVLREAEALVTAS